MSTFGRGTASGDHRAASVRGMPSLIDERLEPRAVPEAYAARQYRERSLVPRCWPTWTRADLLATGWTGRGITAAVRSGNVVRAREDVYLSPDADAACIAACEVGGRLTCVSELARWGVFVLDGGDDLHVEVLASRSRLRVASRRARVHWAPHPPDGWASVGIVEALVTAVRCQSVRGAIATLDSALHQGLIGDRELDEVFDAVPRRLRVLRRHLDRRAESGAETLMRLLLRRLGCRVEVQRVIGGVGRVDFLVDGWLIIECDSEAYHADWAQQKRDRRRDQAAAMKGYVTYRAIAEDIFWHTERPLAAVKGLLAAWAGR